LKLNRSIKFQSLSFKILYHFTDELMGGKKDVHLVAIAGIIFEEELDATQF